MNAKKLQKDQNKKKEEEQTKKVKLNIKKRINKNNIKCL